MKPFSLNLILLATICLFSCEKENSTDPPSKEEKITAQSSTPTKSPGSTITKDETSETPKASKVINIGESYNLLSYKGKTYTKSQVESNNELKSLEKSQYQYTISDVNDTTVINTLYVFKTQSELSRFQEENLEKESTPIVAHKSSNGQNEYSFTMHLYNDNNYKGYLGTIRFRKFIPLKKGFEQFRINLPSHMRNRANSFYYVRHRKICNTLEYSLLIITTLRDKLDGKGESLYRFWIQGPAYENWCSKPKVKASNNLRSQSVNKAESIRIHVSQYYRPYALNAS